MVVVAGPTAVGKTAAGIGLARRFDGEVVNADSRNLYRGMDIGTAKPTPAERAGVPHHLIDVLDPTDEMNLARYQEMAFEAIAGIHGQRRIPFLVGGTPLYVNAVVEGWRIPRVPPDPAFRADKEAQVAAGGLSELMAELAAVELGRGGAQRSKRPASHPRVGDLSGDRPADVRVGRERAAPLSGARVGLTMPRALLHRAIDDRVDGQLRDGLVEEVRALLAAGMPAEAPAMSSLGYRQLVPYLRGEETLAQAAERIRHDTHRYVRHQETWLRRNPRLVAIDVTVPDWQERAAALVAEFVAAD